ncbi:MAG: hypothetical protein EPO03_11505 [Porticoccaceae bacterium]|nr:MAG: hypothetical protein EPO03_11505 [Porticoccaceae bacterium]
MPKPNINAALARQVLRASLLCLISASLASVASADAINNTKANIKNVAGQDNRTPGGPVETTTVKSSKSNSSDRVAHAAGEETERSINLNSSRSNAARAGQAPGDETGATPAPQNGAIVKSKSNITNN